MKPRVAIVCDWLVSRGGAERVIEELAMLYPEAPIYTTIYNEAELPEFKDRDVRTSFLQRAPFSKSKHHLYLPLMPYAVEQFDLSEFDIVISSAHSVAKGVITKPYTMHVSYCHSPMRYCWDGCHEYFERFGLNWAMRIPARHILHNMRIWDRASADRVDYFITNSEYVKDRIAKYYRRKATVIHPPVDTSTFTLPQNIEEPGQYYLAIGRLTPYKRFDLIIDTFNELKLPLLIVGTGKQEAELRRKAGRFITFLGKISDEELVRMYQKAKALIFPQKEDFGITPLEAMSCGVPVIAYGEGGALETIIHKKTGLLFKEQSLDSLKGAVLAADKIQWDKLSIHAHAEKFNRKNFQEKFQRHIDELWEEWNKGVIPQFENFTDREQISTKKVKKDFADMQIPQNR
ncbi:glycosyl transferase [Candidatus Peregrinibacteria bacterium CG11_big_fil_rev_8_21_14_0_20_46_8]|nr:MAG: glycosyl transferase [Candidatus Peregrinibacteria bacterium CG11_big_fil_rev_8_21_14_0_20_46_8]